MNFTTQLKTWAAGIGLAASIMNFTPINAQGVDGFDTIALDAPTQVLLDKSPTWYVSQGTFYSPDLHNGQNDTGLTHNGYNILHGILYHGFSDTNNATLSPGDIIENYYSSAFGFNPNDSSILDYSQLNRTQDLVLGLIDMEANYLNYQAAGDGYFYFNSVDSMYYLNTSPGLSVSDTIQLSNHPDSIYTVDTTLTYSANDAVANTFQFKEIFALAGFDEVVYKENLQDPINIAIPASLIFTNNAPSNNLEIDFDDGLGFRPFTENNSIYYNSFGEKTIRIRRSSSYHDYPITSKTTFSLAQLAFGMPDEIIPFGQGSLPCSISYPFPAGSGVASVILQDSVTHNYKNPFVIVEGFDRGPREMLNDHIKDPLNGWGFGTFNFASFTSGQFGSRAPQLEMSKDFIEQLLEEGYDVVFVDFKTNGHRIESNALALIDFISNQLQPRLSGDNPSSQIPIIGVSMGGLIVRTALLMYEEANCCHNINMYATFSTPHKGANIPLSLQYAFDDMGNNGLVHRDLGENAKKAFNFEISCPAAQQMISNHVLPTANVSRQNFENYLSLYGQPEEALRVALTNGSANSLGHKKIDGNYLQEGDILFSAFVDTMNIDFNFPPYSYTANLLRMTGYADKSQNSGQSNPIFTRGPDLDHNIKSMIGHFAVVLGAVLSFLLLLATTPILSFIGVTIWTTAFLTTINIDANLRINHFTNYNQDDRYLSGQHIALDNVPGDYVANFKTLKDQASGFIDVTTRSHSFVSTVSALDIDTSNYWANIEPMVWTNYITKTIPFDHIWYPGLIEDSPLENQEHVRINQDNIDWIINVLKVLEADPSGHNGTLGEVSSSFNFGQPEDYAEVAPLKFIGSVDVKSGATLSVNSYGQLYNGGFGWTKDNSHFELKTSTDNCTPPVLRNLPGGSIVVGDPNNANSGILRIRKGATLDLRNNSNLLVYGNSSVIIEEGATLIVGVNASINLQENDSKLIIRGKVVIDDYADFTFTGNGEIVYDVNNQLDYAERWSYGPNSTMTLNGSGTGDVVLRVKNGKFWLKHALNFTNAFGGLTISNGDIILEDGSLMSIATPLDMHSVRIDNDGSTLHAGLHLWGQTNVSLNHLTIENGTYGIHANLTSFGSGLSLHNSTIKNCDIGLWTHGKSFRIDNCTFRDNLDYGIYAEDMEGQSQIENSEMRNSFVGLYFQGQEGTKLKALKNDIRDNTNGLEATDCAIELSCNSITNNSTHGINSQRGKIFMNDNAGNVVVNNGGSNLFFMDCYELRLENGMNNFQSTAIQGAFGNISGCFHPNAIGIVPLTTGPSVSLIGNLPNASNTQPHIYMNYCNSGSVYALLSNSYTSMGCAPSTGSGTTPPVHDHPYRMLSDILGSTNSTTVLTTANIQGELLPDALDNSLYLLKPADKGGDILLALDRIDEILTYPYSGLTSSENEILSMAFKMMIEGYGLAIENDLIAKNRAVDGTNENPYLQKINNYLAAAIQDVDPNDPEAYNLLFELKLDQAHVYRMTEHYDYALNALSSAEYFADSEEILRSDYWDCVCTAENRLLKGVIEPEEFNTDIESCQSLLESANKTAEDLVFNESPIISLDENNLKLTPNPTSVSSMLSWTPSPYQSTITISDIKGNMVRIIEVESGSSSLRLYKEQLPEGVYIIQFSNQNSTQTIRWIVQ